MGLKDKIVTYREFVYDACDFLKYNLLAAEANGDYKYRIMLLVHSLEKGMCMTSPRPFGEEKVNRLIKIISSTYSDRWQDYEYRLAISVLMAYKQYYDEQGWNEEAIYAVVEEFLKDKTENEYKAGYKVYRPLEIVKGIEAESAINILLKRSSVRDFADRPIESIDLDFALKCFQSAPTACNRQMCKVYDISDGELRQLLHDKITGISGFNTDTINYFVITYDVAAFQYLGERKQGLLNAGLCTMNFINGLHSRGIGSCCLQWTNRRSEDKLVRERLGIPASERIAIVVGAGYYLEDNRVPCSVRKV